MLRINEVTSLECGSIDIIPGERAYYEVRLKTRKTAQTGILHSWTLHTNDNDLTICPVRALIRVAMLYGKETTPWSPLFLRVHPLGAVLTGQPVVRTNFAFQCNVLIVKMLMLKTTSILSHSLSQDLQEQVLVSVRYSHISLWWMSAPHKGQQMDDRHGGRMGRLVMN
jgi:hypothetical protein